MNKKAVIYEREIGTLKNIEILPYKIPHEFFKEELFKKMIELNIGSYENKNYIAVPLRLFSNEDGVPLKYKLLEIKENKIDLDINVKFARVKEDSFKFELTRLFDDSSIKLSIYCKESDDMEKGFKGINIYKNNDLSFHMNISQKDIDSFGKGKPVFLEKKLNEFKCEDKISLELCW